MARTGWSATNFLRRASGILTATPVTMACWANTSAHSAATQEICGLYASGSLFNRNSIRINVDPAADAIAARTSDGAAANQAVSSTAVSFGAWFHACGVFASATDRRAFLNGGGKGTDTGSRTPTGIDRFSVGVGDGSAQSNPFAPSLTGFIAEVGLWNVALADIDVAILALGVCPLQVRPDALVGYWPIIGVNSPENNYMSNTTTLSVQGTLTQVAHPRIFMPRKHFRLL